MESKKTAMAQLREKVRETVAEEVLPTTHELVDVVRERFPDAVAEAADWLVYDAIATMSRRIRKSTAKALKSPQWVLPLGLAHLKLPAEISLPSQDKDGEPVWVRLEEATLNELDAHLAFLSKNIAADTQRFKDLGQLRRFIAPHIDDDPTGRFIGEVLAEVVAAEQDAA